MISNRMGSVHPSLTRGRWSGWIVPASLTGVMVGLTACGGTGLQGDRIAQAIQDDVIKQGGTSLKAVTCPSNIKPEVGSSFECIGEIDTGYTFTISVKQNDDKGNVVWDVPSAKGLLNVAKLQTLIQASLQSELGTRPVVACGGTYKPIKPGQTFDCKLDYKQPDLKKEGKDAPGAKPGANEPAAATPTAQTTPTAPDAARSPSGQPGKGQSEKILVSIDPQGHLSWQRVLPDRGQKVATTAGVAQPGAKTIAPANNAAPGAAPPPQATADDFLNQPGATESLED